MGKSQETFGKKEVRKKNEKKRKDKEQKRAKKKTEGKSNFDDMIAYVDEFGKISSTPPDPDRKIAVSTESIELKITRNNSQNTPDFIRKGILSTFNKSKGYGFIRDLKSGLSIFVHINSMLESIKENDVVVFELGKGPKGPSAMKVKLFKELPEDQ